MDNTFIPKELILSEISTKSDCLTQLNLGATCKEANAIWKTWVTELPAYLPVADEETFKIMYALKEFTNLNKLSINPTPLFFENAFLFTKLTSLTLTESFDTPIDNLSLLTNLTYLDTGQHHYIGHNHIVPLTKLEHLVLASNIRQFQQVLSTPVSIDTLTGLQRLTRLNILNLSQNAIPDDDIPKLTQLRCLEIQNIHSSECLTSLTNLTSLNWQSGAPINHPFSATMKELIISVVSLQTTMIIGSMSFLERLTLLRSAPNIWHNIEKDALLQLTNLKYLDISNIIEMILTIPANPELQLVLSKNTFLLKNVLRLFTGTILYKEDIDGITSQSSQSSLTTDIVTINKTILDPEPIYTVDDWERVWPVEVESGLDGMLLSKGFITDSYIDSEMF